MMNKFLNLYRYEYFVPLFAFFAPIHERISTFIIFLGLLALLLQVSIRRYKISWNKFLGILPLFYIIYIISVLFLSQEFDFKWIEQRASFIAFPILFLGSNYLNPKKVFQFFVYGCITSYILCLGYALFNSVNIDHGSLIFDPLINSSRGFWEAIMYEGNYFFAEHFSVLIQTSYFGFYLCLALAIVILYDKDLFAKNERISFFILIFLGILQTMSIAAFGGLFIVLSIMVMTQIKRIRVRVATYVVLGCLLILGAYTQPRLKILVKDVIKSEIQLNPNERYGVMLRFLSWDAALEVIKENLLFGVGVTNVETKMIHKYEEKDYIYPLKLRLNSHNQFLQTMLDTGLLGLSVLVGIFVLLIIKSRRVSFKEKVFIITFTILLSFNFIFENYFNRYIGISVVCFFYCFCVTMIEKDEYEVKSQ